MNTTHAVAGNHSVDLADGGWSGGNRFEFLENGEEYFPAVFRAIGAAQREVLIETFILFEDSVGLQLQAVLIAAAGRGVSVDLTVDGYGSPDLSAQFIGKLTDAGVRVHFYDPRPRLLGMRTNLFRRMHRKIVSIDSSIAFIGGINFGEDHLMSYGELAKQDYAVSITGPLARDIRRFAREQVAAFGVTPSWWPLVRRAGRSRWPAMWPVAREHIGKAILVVRDNDRHRDDIERHYRAAIRSAKREIVIACAYFFPGYRLLKQLRRAARRGVAVKLILQGAPDMPQARTWARLLYPSLLRAGVEIHEYCQRPLHAKVAVIDNQWVTVGSSNLDPLSLALNLEANVVVRDADFSREVRSRLEPLMALHCRLVNRKTIPRGSLWSFFSNVAAYHCTRHFPRWAGWLPAHTPRMHSAGPQYHSQPAPANPHVQWSRSPREPHSNLQRDIQSPVKTLAQPWGYW